MVVVAVGHGGLVGAGPGHERALVLRLLLPPRDAEGGRGLLVALQRLAQHGRDVVHVGGGDAVGPLDLGAQSEGVLRGVVVHVGVVRVGRWSVAGFL